MCYYILVMILRRIKETTNFTEIEKQIAKYILDNPDHVIQNSAKELAVLTYTSAPSIVRFCKKIGTTGYPDFRMQFIEEYTQMRLLDQDQITTQSSLSDILRLLPQRYTQITRNSADRIEKLNFHHIINQFRNATTIDFYATGINHGIAQAACVRFSNLGYHAQVQLGINKHYINSLADNHNNRVLSFILSHSGTNEAILEAARFLKSRNFTIVYLGLPNNELHALSDYFIYWGLDEYDLAFDNLAFPISLMFILDCIYLQLSSYKKSISSGHETFDKIKTSI